MKISEIIIKDSFKKYQTKRSKIQNAIDFYKENGRFDKAVVVNKDNELVDGYARYQAAIEMGLDNVPIYNKPKKVTLIYAKHDGNEKIYTWRLKDSLFGTEVSEGMKAIVFYKGKSQVVTITKSETVDSNTINISQYKKVHRVIN